MSSSIDEMKDEIKSAFAKVGLKNVPVDILVSCAALAETLNKSAEDFATQWECFSLSKSFTKLDHNSWNSFKMSAIKEFGNGETETLRDEMKTTPGAVVSRPSLGGEGSKRDNGGLNTVTPPAKKRFNAQQTGGAIETAASVGKRSSSSNKRVSLSPAPPSTANKNKPLPSNVLKYSDRKNVGKVVFNYQPEQLKDVETSAAVTASSGTTANRRCEISYDFPTNVKEPYRHLFTTLQEKAQALDDRIEEIGNNMIDKFGLGRRDESANDRDDGIAPLECVGVARQEKVTCIGRICNSAHEGGINSASILLEGSRESSEGRRAELDLSFMDSSKIPYSLFPGQIVAVEGMNPSGRKMVAQRICEGAAQEPLKTPVKELLHYHHDDTYQGGAPLKLMTACGPYTTSNNLEFEPLNDLINVINDENPDVVILAGPFVSMDHPDVKSGQTTLKYEGGEEVLVPFDTFFANHISGLIEQLFAENESLKTQFVLVPSLEDATAEWVYPQPPFSDPRGKNLNIPGAEGIEAGTLGLHHIETSGRDDGGPRRIHCVSNPCTLKINEIVVGVTSTDVLRHMSADLSTKHLESGARMGRIAQHLLQQRSYYPLFPPALNTNLDWKQHRRWEMPCQPDLLIIPSLLKSFARPVMDSTVVINPGQLCKSTTGGTYAMVEVHPIKRETLENAGGGDVEVLHSVQDRTRIVVKHI